MKSVNMHEAKTHLSRLVAQVAEGESIIIAKSGRSVAKLSPLDSVAGPGMRRTGFLVGRIRVPEDFDRMGEVEIAQGFEAVEGEK